MRKQSVPKTLFHRALQFHQEKKLQAALEAYQTCLKGDPANTHALINHAVISHELGDVATAIRLLTQAVELSPNDAEAHYNLGNAFWSSGLREAALEEYRKATAIKPEFGGAWHNLGVVLEALGQYPAAGDAYRKALTLAPGSTASSLNLANVYAKQGQFSEARATLIDQLARCPNDYAALNNLAALHQEFAEHVDAIALLKRALALQPTLDAAQRNVLMGLQYQPEVAVEDLNGKAQEWGSWVVRQAAHLKPESPSLHGTRKGSEPLRVGYVSADFGRHPVGLFLRQVLARHDPSRVKPFCYAARVLTDEIADAIRKSVTTISGEGAWQDVSALTDVQLCQRIRQDKIDVLVDLGGHTDRSRISVFALRPAPVQISWLGYFATTGLPTMDFVILDPWHAPAGTEAQFTERIIRLPNNRFCYTPVDFAPDVSPAPVVERGYVVFGSFNNTAKLNDTVLDVWAQILRGVPDSHLILKWRTLADPVYRDRITRFFAEHGVSADRIELRPASPHGELLAQYADVDIALDPFPFSGGYTSCEALWMGVPVVTLPQARVVSRQTWSFLNAIGLQELAAQSVDEYMARAIALAGRKNDLKQWRETLRARMRKSPLCDVAAFTYHLEEAYRLAWREQTGEQLPDGTFTSGNQAPAMDAEKYHHLGIEALQAGNAEAARMHIEIAIRLAPDVAGYHANLGVALKSLGKLEERIACYQRAIELAPREAQYHSNLSAALSQATRHAESESAARRALELAPNVAEYWFNLGTCLASQQRWEEAATSFDRALECRPGWLVALKTAGEAWRTAGHWQRAVARFHEGTKAITAETSASEIVALLRALGDGLMKLHNYGDAAICYRDVLKFQPNSPESLTDLGNALKQQGLFDEARDCYLAVVEHNPKMAAGYCNLGTVAQMLGDYDAAIAYYRHSVAIDPALGLSWTNLGNCLTYSPRHGPEEVLAVLREFDAKLAQPLLDVTPHANERNPLRRLKVGYVSPDFRKHAVAYFALPLLEGHRKDQVEIFCYYNHRQNDEWTAAFKKAADHWCDCAAFDDDALAARIRADGVDILVDLSGHTENNRLLVFARKPAPVQVTWMGYVTTTGLSAMDWRVTHQDADPLGSDKGYAERLYRLPGAMWCYRPLPTMPAVSPAPVLKNGYVTFGSFNRYSKNSAAVLEAWARILRGVGDSRLVICVPEGKVRQQMTSFFTERGIASERLVPFAKVSHEEFWKLHSEVDIALDPFPFGGGTTTCETLWLGVPVVTVSGNAEKDFAPRFASRMGAAFLKNIGVPELACETVSQYVETATALGHDPELLSGLRQVLRTKMARAPLTDETRFVSEMEDAYRAMWLDWCRKH